MTDNPLAAVLREHKPGDASYWGRPVCSCRWENPAIGFDSDAGHAAWVQHVVPLLQAAQVEAAHAALLPGSAPMHREIVR